MVGYPEPEIGVWYVEPIIKVPSEATWVIASSPNYGGQAIGVISSRGMVIYPNAEMKKTITWGDGSKETIQVTEKGRIFINGKEVTAFGFNVARYGDWGDLTDEAANRALDRLMQDGVRFMALNVHWWLIRQEEIESVLDFWMPKLYAHKMFVLLFMSDAVEEEGYGVPIGQPTVEWQMNRINIVLNKLSQNKNWADIIFAFGITWELDIFWTGTSDQIEAYLSTLYTAAKNATASVIGNVPLIGKVVSGWGQGPEHLISKAIIRWSDIPCIDFYPTLKDSELDYDWIAPRITLFHEVADAVGKSGINVWYTEFGLGDGENSLFDKQKLEYGLSECGYNDLSLMIIWELWDRTGKWSAFDSNGNPLDWYVKIAPYFPR
jgi:hypothetical protein